MIALPLWRRLPHLNVQPVTMRYPQLLASMLKLLRQEKVLQVRGVLALFMFAAFNIFWSALVLPLSAPPYNFSHTVIGSFGLFGVIGALAATRAGPMGRPRICSAHKLGSTVNIAARMVAAFTYDLLTLGAGDWHSIARLRWTSPACDQPKYDFSYSPRSA